MIWFYLISKKFRFENRSVHTRWKYDLFSQRISSPSFTEIEILSVGLKWKMFRQKKWMIINIYFSSMDQNCFSIQTNIKRKIFHWLKYSSPFSLLDDANEISLQTIDQSHTNISQLVQSEEYNSYSDVVRMKHLFDLQSKSRFSRSRSKIIEQHRRHPVKVQLFEMSKSNELISHRTIGGKKYSLLQWYIVSYWAILRKILL